MSPTVTHNAERHRFEAHVEGGTAHADYNRAGRRVTFYHTEVPAEAEGRGVGASLVAAALDWAEREGLGVVPQCPFFAAYLARHPDRQALVPADARKWLDPDYDEPRR